APGWIRSFEWIGWRRFDELPHSRNPAAGYFAVTNDNPARSSRLRELFDSHERIAVDDFERWQHDTLAWSAERLVPLLMPLHVERQDAEAARQQLLAWDKRMSVDRTEATLYAFWEQILLQRFTGARLDKVLARSYAARAGAVADAL